MPLTIDPVRSRADLRAFVALPRMIYRDMPGFAAPLDYERLQMLDPAKSPFYAHGEAAYWIARQDGRAVGRISAQIDRLANSPECAKAGFFGCIDAIDHHTVVQALMETAEAWILAHGRSSAQGPYLLSINGESGLLIDGHAAPPMVMMPWHPPYLEKCLTDIGYRRVQTLLSFSLDLRSLDVKRWQNAIGRRRRDSRIHLRGLNMGKLAAEGQTIQAIFNDAWTSNWGFAPLADADIDALRHGFKPFLNGDSAVVAEKDGQPIGFMLALPNVFEIISDVGGAPSLLGWIRVAARTLRKRYASVRIILMGVPSQYQATPLGAEIAVAMISEMIARASKYRIRTIEAGWILQGNASMIQIMQALGFKQNRAYGIFEKSLIDHQPASRAIETANVH